MNRLPHWFFVGGSYVATPDGSHFAGQMYVEHYAPDARRHETPVVMVHGGVQTGTNFTSTADGRPGWAFDFLEAGFDVYVIEQPERGRSGHQLADGVAAPQFRYTAERTADYFTDPAASKLWPTAERHTEWPGTGRMGDPAFDRFFASQVSQLADRDAIEANARDGLVALLDEIGPAILLTHSQSGPFGWLVADARSDLVKGILAIEPNGPPFRDVQFTGAPNWFKYGDELGRPWGITRLPMTYDPPIVSAADLKPVLDKSLATDVLAPGYMPTCGQRRLPNLAGVPILIVTGEASYHASYDHCTSAFLTWAGVEHDFQRLEEAGLPGNSHMIMMENNSREVASALIEWLVGTAL